MGSRTGMAGTKRLGRRDGKTAVPMPQEVRQCDSWLPKRIGQLDSGGGLSTHGSRCSTGQSHGKDDGGPDSNERDIGSGRRGEAMG